MNANLSDPAFRAKQDIDYAAIRGRAEEADRLRARKLEIEKELNSRGDLISGDVSYGVAEWIDVKEVAKLVRSALREEFPGAKFSVKMDRFSGGTSIHVGYSEAFAEDREQVKKLRDLIEGFESNRFDGMTDSGSSISNWLSPSGRMVPAYCAAFGTNPAEDHPNPGGWKLVQSGAKFVSCQRMF
jgi:hypothetical protein